MATIPASENEFPEVLFAEGAAPAAPAAGLVKAYAKADGLLYSKDDAGTETALGADLSAHTGDTSDAHDASSISVADAGAVFTGTDVEAVLAELQASIAGGGIAATIFDAQGDLIVASAADTAARLALGASGTVLTSNGTTAAWATPSGGSLPAAKDWLTENDDARDYPASPNATYDDEFNDDTGMSGSVNGLDARWNWRNQGGASVSWGNAGWLTLNVPAKAGGSDWRILEIAAFADGTYEARIAMDAAYNTGASTGFHGGVVLVDNTNGDFYHIGFASDNVTKYYGVVQRWTNVTTFNSNIAAEGQTTGIPSHLYVRVVKSGTTISLWHSSDGIGWHRRTTFTDAVSANRIGIGANEGSANTGLVKLHVDYFRKVA